MRNLIISLICLAVFTSCNNKAEEQKQFARMNSFEDQNIVVTGFARRATFFREFESNGKLKAVRRATLKFELDEEIRSVDVKNGQRVSKGQVLSVLDDINQKYNFERACRTLDKSRLQLEDALIGMGYDLKDSLSVPAPMMKIALIRSGYSDAVSEKELALIKLHKTNIVAPFQGVVAGLEAKPFNRTSQYKDFCTLIDDASFEVEFPVLESEAAKLKQRMPLRVIPYAFDNDTIEGYISAINPMVNDAGMVLAKAVVPNNSGRITEGMNVKVIVRDAVPNQLIVPKSAVTLRQERKVVFVCKNDTAHWRYVNVNEENSQFCTLNGEDIKPGEEVIVDGNFNLSHLAPVVKMSN
nr:efflux RND transporter periplasmic adaptor subunit [uncultured Draconibacterium sp.]